MASALIVLFLGCWLVGQSGAWGGREYPKPTVWVSPSRVVAIGGSVTIRCEGLYLDMEFFLRKAGHLNVQVQPVPDGTVAEFPIPSVSREDGGSYTCDYRSITEPNRWSYLSDPVEIIVADSSLPRPSISLSSTGVTAPGADVTICCQGPRWDVRFFLHKAGDLNPQRHMDTAGAGAEFRIPTVGRQHGGSYSCSYRPRQEPFVSSQPSDTVQLVVGGGTDPTQPGAVPAPTRLGSAEPGGLESLAPPGLTSPIIAGVSVAATSLLLLLLLVAFVCFRKTRARKGAAPRPSR
ncbi:immunoglobulin superfamily member 1-like [Malaclemys terrapin pileata]|uniref:immunoglobulin superfamily member 1-like n=1 Tax=Malaclemys terrapin pileata TaxID=2991368 RepID=UPI0023A81946|nr:immunoglobulin superfamily member 1-like [Malaclemys terrapin pileata]